MPQPDGSDKTANQMRALVPMGQNPGWEAGRRSAAELREAAAHFVRASALCPPPAVQAALAEYAAWCRTKTEAM